jgi:hypothetical protein
MKRGFLLTVSLLLGACGSDDEGEPEEPGGLGAPCSRDADCKSQFTCGFETEGGGWFRQCTLECESDGYYCADEARESDGVCVAGSDVDRMCVKNCEDSSLVCPEGTFCNDSDWCERTER